MINVATAIRHADTFVPKLNECNKSRMVAPSFVFTMYIPANERNIPTAAMSIGAITALIWMSALKAKAVAPRAAVLSMLPQ